MLAARIIPCLDVRDGVVVKGVRFKGHVALGGIVELAKRYCDQGADELVFYDITASIDRRLVCRKWIEKVASEIDIPFCVAGGIRTIEDARMILSAGADKISLNSPALERPALISELADTFGRQCVVIGIDSMACLDRRNDYRVYQYTGSDATTTITPRRTCDWIEEVQVRGAGEVVLNCMNADGTKAGFDITQLRAMRSVCRIPLIASGGAGCVEDFADVFHTCKVDGALAAGMFHRGEATISEVKRYLINRKIEVRLYEQT